MNKTKIIYFLATDSRLIREYECNGETEKSYTYARFPSDRNGRIFKFNGNTRIAFESYEEAKEALIALYQADLDSHEKSIKRIKERIRRLQKSKGESK